MRAYYNENDKNCTAWLRELIAAKLIAHGDVDDRDIRDVKPAELRGYTQCHFFAGIGGWSLALRQAAWPDHRPVWTGSCPCQPFSAAGRRRGFADERHLWPYWHWLIQQCTPTKIYGEQVSTAPLWLDGVCADLEACKFAVGAAHIPAVSVGAKHIRYRAWFTADSECEQLWDESRWSGGAHWKSSALAAINGEAWTVANAAIFAEREPAEKDKPVAGDGLARSITCSNGQPMAYTNSKPTKWVTIPRCERNTWRPEPAVGRVVDGLSHSMVEAALHGFGNAIVPQVAAAFIRATS
jgi:DNA (cytosine-5)-methyltransferase 1